MADLETVDIPAVEVLSTGGPVHGQGSPPEGDFWTLTDLRAMAAAARELADEIQPPNKIGHSDAQNLVKNSALPAATPGEMPAVGWLDPTTARVVEDGSGGGKLVMDAKAVPKKFAALIESGAYRTRSVELSRVTSQATQKVYDWVVTGLAWLGAKLPAVQTLDDVYALYEARQLDKPDDVRAIVLYADGTTAVWGPDTSFAALRDDVSEALNGPMTGGATEPRFWVCDISLDQKSALVQDYYNDGDDGWIVPFTVGTDGEVKIAVSSDWQPVEQAWVASDDTDDLAYARKLLAAAPEKSRRAESRPMDLTLTDEQVTAVREKLGIEGDAEITPETLVEAAEARANELAEAKKTAEERKNESDTETVEQLRKLEADLEAEKKRSFEQRRDADIKEALRTRELEPADVEKWEKRYETLGEETARELLFELPERDTIREYGRDDDGSQPSAEERRNENAELNEIFPGADLPTGAVA